MTKFYVDFQSMLNARKAVDKLKAMGYHSAHLDLTSRFTTEYSTEINLPGTTKGPSLSRLVLKSGSSMFSVDKAPLIATHPMVSGMGSFSDITENLGARLIVNVEDGKLEEVKSSLRELGAEI